MEKIDSVEYTETNRATVPALEGILDQSFPVLDHGFIRVVDYMGSDEAIVQAARVSYGKGTKQTSQDRGLIRYLMRHRHTTPFEMCEIKFHIKLPIFVARQWIRHRTANVNEYSARYSVLDKEFYVPTQKNTAAQSENNKQGRGDILDEGEASESLNSILMSSNEAYSTYERLLNEEETSGKQYDPKRKGMARELARMVLPTNYYTQWYWKIDLHNLLHFIALRADHHAQFEIRVYADILGDIVSKWVPLAWEAFQDYSRNAVHLSAQETELLQKMLKGESSSSEKSGLSKREWEEFCKKFNISQ
ncbi:MAG: FAD-dependent thymidylate synthase [Candidatus Nitrotoga sp.]